MATMKQEILHYSICAAIIFMRGNYCHADDADDDKLTGVSEARVDLNPISDGGSLHSISPFSKGVILADGGIRKT